ncbi:SRPBCC family protein [Streptosporangium sp. NPDC051022]|uniref:SRPBCC family protein n=1 Tax=Streptosporangium sp. NPDC051022 TaxID=3155752 RepID=UPI00343B08BF
MRNIQQRLIDAPAGRLGALLDRAATADDRLWPVPAWPPLVLDAGLTPGSRGGHGPIRYSVCEYEPGRRARFLFDQATGLDGHHEFLITAQGPDHCRLTHTITCTVRGRMRILWPLAIRWLHEALIHDLFDNAERAATGRLSRRPARWSPWVRLLRRVWASRRS